MPFLKNIFAYKLDSIYDKNIFFNNFNVFDVLHD